MVRRLVFVGVAALALVSLGCKSSCRQLSEKLCECQVTTVAKTQCLQRVAAEETRIAPSAADEAECQRWLPLCDCHLINEPIGKVRCGLARGDAGL